MNKEQVLSALKSCGFNKADCDHCPYYNEKNCIHKLMQDAYSFLNEPQKEKKICVGTKPEACYTILPEVHKEPELEPFCVAYCPLCRELTGQEIAEHLFICAKCNTLFLDAYEN